MKYVSTLLTLILLAGCSSTPEKNTSETQEEKVISRIDDLDERPDWLKESKPFKVQSGKITSLGSTVIPGDHRLSAAYRIAQNNAKANIATAIEQRLEFIFQNAEERTELDTTQARYIGAEASKLSTSSIRLTNRYWEKVATTKDSGDRVTQYRVFVTVEMPESDFKKAILAAANKDKVKRSISSDFSDKVNKHWDTFTSSEAGAVDGK